MVSFGGMLGQLGSAIIIIPLIAILESVAIAKAFGEIIHHLLIKQHHHNPSNSHLSWDGIPLFYVWVWLELSLERLTNLGWQVSWQRNSKFVFPMISSYESASDSEYTILRICINSLLLFTCCFFVCWVPWKELKQNKRKKSAISCWQMCNKRWKIQG